MKCPACDKEMEYDPIIFGDEGGFYCPFCQYVGVPESHVDVPEPSEGADAVKTDNSQS